jgi:hypothetical protein
VSERAHGSGEEGARQKRGEEIEADRVVLKFLGVVTGKRKGVARASIEAKRSESARILLFVSSSFGDYRVFLILNDST